jgi:hypothetical protein
VEPFSKLTEEEQSDCIFPNHKIAKTNKEKQLKNNEKQITE